MASALKIAKDIVKWIVYRPSGVTLGRDSIFKRPRYLLNRHRISVGARCRIGRHVVFNPIVAYEGRKHQGSIVLGDDVYIGGYTQIHAMSHLEIGDGCVLSEHIYVSDIAHGLDPKGGLIMKQPLESKGPVRLGKNVFVGYGCSILPGVALGDGCIVGTRSTVTRSFPAYSMIAGSPAVLIKRYSFETSSWEPIVG